MGRVWRRLTLHAVTSFGTLCRVEPSEEIRRIVHRWTEAIAAGDAGSTLARLSEHPGTLIVGTDPDEWWRGQETHAIWGRQIGELGSFPVTADEIDAWEEGTVGWASVKETITWAGKSFESRATYVLHLEQGDWKVVQVHWSLPQANVEVFGRSLTVSLEQLEETIQRERPDLSGALAADGTVTIVFTDIVDSTVLNNRLGDHAWLGVLRRHNAIVEDATSAQGGRVVKTQGDGSMLAFASARRAVACSQEIQAGIRSAFADATPPISVRIGVHSGDAVRETDDFFGNTVNYAARVASQALGGEVLVSSLVRELVAGGGPGIAFLESREVELKGLEGTHRIYALAPAEAHDREQGNTSLM
jgi:class 3 adenylate cyclase/ketosteroid isomerase-like protein